MARDVTHPIAGGNCCPEDGKSASWQRRVEMYEELLAEGKVREK